MFGDGRILHTLVFTLSLIQLLQGSLMYTIAHALMEAFMNVHCLQPASVSRGP